MNRPKAALYSDFDDTLARTDGGLSFFALLLFRLSPYSEDEKKGVYESLLSMVHELYAGNMGVIEDIRSRYNEAIGAHTLEEINRFVREGNYPAEFDKETISLINGLKNEHGDSLLTGIITSNYLYCVKHNLETNGYDGIFDRIIANAFEENSGRAYFMWRVRNKADILEKEISELCLERSNVAYIGNDKLDESALEVSGIPVISRLAEEDFKKRWRGRALILGEDDKKLEETITGILKEEHK